MIRRNLYVFVLLLVLVFINLTGCSDNTLKEEPEMETSNIKEQAIQKSQEFMDTDPMYKKWLEIDQKTKPFKRDQKWIEAAFKVLLDPQAEWMDILSAQGFTLEEELKKVENIFDTMEDNNEEEVYGELEGEIYNLRNQMKDLLIRSPLLNNTPYHLPVEEEKLLSIANKYDYGFSKETPSIDTISWTYKWRSTHSHKTPNGVEHASGKGIFYEINPNKAITRLVISMGTLDKEFDNNIHGINYMSSKIEKDTMELIKLAVNDEEKAKRVFEKLNEISKLDGNKLSEIRNNKERTDFTTWSTSLEDEDYDITIGYSAEESPPYPGNFYILLNKKGFMESLESLHPLMDVKDQEMIAHYYEFLLENKQSKQ